MNYAELLAVKDHLERVAMTREQFLELYRERPPPPSTPPAFGRCGGKARYRRWLRRRKPRIWWLWK